MGVFDEKQHEAALKQTLRGQGRPTTTPSMPSSSPRCPSNRRRALPRREPTRGLRVYHILKADQEAAYASLRRGVFDYDRRHGYRGAESFVDLKDVKSDQDEALDELLADIVGGEDLSPAIVLEAGSKQVKAYRKGGDLITLPATH